MQTRRIVVLVSAVFLLAFVAFAAIIAVRNYDAAKSLINTETPSPLLKSAGAAGLENVTSVTFSSRGSHLAGWYVPSKNRAAVIVTHGSISDRAGMIAEIRLLSAAGFGVLAFDWPGLGESEGSIRWGAQAKDALTAAIDWIVAQPDVDPNRVGGLGFSIGGFVLTQVAAEDRRLRAVVIESAASDFDAYVDFHYGKWGALSRWPARWALRNSGLFTAEDAALRRIEEISPRPVLIIGQTGDQVVPVSMLRDLHDAARAPKELWLIDGARHGSYEEAAGEEYSRRLRKFFEENLTEALVASP